MPLRLAELHWSAERIYIWNRNPVQIYVEQQIYPMRARIAFLMSPDDGMRPITESGENMIAKDSRQLGRRTYWKVGLALAWGLGGLGVTNTCIGRINGIWGLSLLAFLNDIA
jgi:hypothetical protein